MNQILYSTDKQEKSNINKIIMVFCIIIIVFSLFFIVQGSFALVKNKDKKDINSEDLPNVTIESKGGTATLKVTSKENINKIIYYWDDGNESQIDVNNTQIEENLTVPNGDCTLNIKVIDEKGIETKFKQEFKFDPSIDIASPEIKISGVPGKITIEVTDNKELDYITYKWNDGKETTVKASGEDLSKIVQDIDVKKGENTLKVVAVDKSGNKKEKEEKVIGSSKPKISVERSGSELIIKVTDEEEVTKIEYNLNGTTHTKEDINGNKKEVEIKEALIKGDNLVVVRAYNKSGLSRVFTGKCTY